MDERVNALKYYGFAGTYTVVSVPTTTTWNEIIAWVPEGFHFIAYTTGSNSHIFKWGDQCQRCLIYIFVKMALFAPNGLLVTWIHCAIIP
jgi:hypothetical protein